MASDRARLSCAILESRAAASSPQGKGCKTVDQIKAMHACEKKKHADLCNKNKNKNCSILAAPIWL